MREKIFIIAITAVLSGLLSILAINLYILNAGSRFIMPPASVPPAQTILVLGAAVYKNGRLSDMYHDRAQTALEVFKAGKAPTILVSGDNSTKDYDEVTPVKTYLIDRGVPSSSIVLDYAGFDTYDSLYRAREIFGVTSTIIVTQNFHLPRALYLARNLNMIAYGVNADLRTYRGTKYSYLREWGARTKAWWNVLVSSKPKFLGEKIPLATPQ
jgi:vancomycin permeability regulator SanA